MLRAVEGLNVAETAECLALSLETVKTRLHRARSLFFEESDLADKNVPGSEPYRSMQDGQLATPLWQAALLYLDR